MIDLSIIIVNYNVKYFITQCLYSLFKKGAIGVSYEIIVVDNASSDGSFPFLENKFDGRVTFIKNSENIGFGRACNVGFAKSKGRYILFLNPDTLVPNQTLDRCVSILEDANFQKVVAMGVKLVDGGGRFLPESKRSFPTIWNSFCKLSGLAKIFPESKIFGGYNLTFLPENESAYVDALCGAFLMIRRSAFQNTGGFDEEYFMYGEDLDLCKRLKKSGGLIYYYADENIVHFKGESHKKKDLKYYTKFYNAMHIYAGKHFSKITGMAIKLAILCAGLFSYLLQKLSLLFKIIIDLFVLMALIFFIKNFWARIVYHDSNYYDERFYLYGITFPLIFIASFYISQSYDSKKSFRNTVSGYLIGSIVSLIAYSLFPENLRFSRSILLIFIVLTPLVLWFWRVILFAFLKGRSDNNISQRVAFVGDYNAFQNFKKWSGFLDNQIEIVGYINDNDNGTLGSLESLNEIIDTYLIDQIIFDSNYEDFDDIYGLLAQYGRRVKFKISGDREMGVIGSDNANIAGDVYLFDFNYKITDYSSRFLKRLLDVSVSGILLLTFPVWLLYHSKVLKNAISVLFYSETWVGYAPCDKIDIKLPSLRPSIISIDRFQPQSVNTTSASYNFDHNVRYAKNYSIFVDLDLIINYLFKKKGKNGRSNR